MLEDIKKELSGAWLFHAARDKGGKSEDETGAEFRAVRSSRERVVVGGGLLSVYELLSEDFCGEPDVGRRRHGDRHLPQKVGSSGTRRKQWNGVAHSSILGSNGQRTHSEL